MPLPTYDDELPDDQPQPFDLGLVNDFFWSPWSLDDQPEVGEVVISGRRGMTEDELAYVTDLLSIIDQLNQGRPADLVRIGNTTVTRAEAMATVLNALAALPSGLAEVFESMAANPLFSAEQRALAAQWGGKLGSIGDLMQFGSTLTQILADPSKANIMAQSLNFLVEVGVDAAASVAGRAFFSTANPVGMVLGVAIGLGGGPLANALIPDFTAEGIRQFFSDIERGVGLAGTMAVQAAQALGHLRDAGQYLDEFGNWTISPIIIDLDGDGVELVSVDQSAVTWDVDRDGHLDRVAWVGSDDAILAFDADGSGDVNDVREFMLSGWAPGGGTDLDGLRAFDSNGDNVFDARDEAFAAFGMWRDLDGDGESDAGEFVTLAEAGIAAISVQREGGAASIAGNFIHGFTSATTDDGRTLQVADATFDAHLTTVLSSTSVDDLFDLSHAALGRYVIEGFIAEHDRIRLGQGDTKLKLEDDADGDATLTMTSGLVVEFEGVSSAVLSGDYFFG